MTVSVKAFDTTATIDSSAWFASAYSAGYRLYILHTTMWGSSTPWPNAPGQIKLALDAGLSIAAYTRNPSWYSNGIKACAPYISKLQFFCLDVETDPGIRATWTMVDGVKALGVRPVIYSGYGMWSEVMGGNVTSFSTVPLWDTNATDPVPATFTPDINSPAPVAYGGWNTLANPRIGIQQGFNTDLNGVIVDVSSFNSAFLTPASATTYTVKAGDTWAGIAAANNLALAALMQANPPVPGQIITL